MSSMRHGEPLSVAPGQLAYVCPSYIKDEFTEACTLEAVLSFRHHTPEQICLVLDDASPRWPQGFEGELQAAGALVKRFPESGGLTRSWNEGLRWASSLGCRWVAVSNNDVLFTPGWEDPLLWAVERLGFALVGPVTNCPGVTAFGGQDIRIYVDGYQPSDLESDLIHVAAELRTRHFCAEQASAYELPINGFCLFAAMERWHAGRFRGTADVFDPRYPMVGNEDELQARWKRKGWKIGFCPGSFLFHYRSAARGDRHRLPGSFRPGKTT